MPTGYTADVQSGKVTEFPDFAMQCARAFGALIMMRDDPADAPIPEFQPSDYHSKALATAEADVARLSAMTAEQAQTEADAEHAKAVRQNNEWNAEKAACRERYEAMILKVDAWTPPTPDHNGLKEFMLKQLRESIDFDCRPYDEPKALPGAEWLEKAKARAARSVEYHRDEHAAEVKRTADRNAWVRNLRESLTQPEPAASEMAAEAQAS
jgi:hypothetical protein